MEDITDLGHLPLHLTKYKTNTKAQGKTILRKEVDTGLKQTKIHSGSNSEYHTQSDKQPGDSLNRDAADYVLLPSHTLLQVLSLKGSPSFNREKPVFVAGERKG